MGWNDHAWNAGEDEMKTYELCIKSHCEAPDFEVEVEANNVEEAVDKLIEKYQWLKGWDRQTLINKTATWD